MVAEAGEVNIEQPIVDPVQHLESVVERACVVQGQAVPFQTVEYRFNGTGCPVYEMAAGIPCCSSRLGLLADGP